MCFPVNPVPFPAQTNCWSEMIYSKTAIKPPPAEPLKQTSFPESILTTWIPRIDCHLHGFVPVWKMRPRKQPSQQQKPHRVEPRLPGKAQPPPPSRPTPSTRPVDEGIIYGLYHQSTRVIPYHHCATGGKENEHSAATRHQQSSANRRKSKHFPPSRKERGGTHVRAWLAALYCRTAIFQISNSIILLSKHLNACHVASAWRQLFFLRSSS